MVQDDGAETNRKNRGIPKQVCRDFFNSFMPNRLGQIAHFNFGVRVESDLSLPPCCGSSLGTAAWPNTTNWARSASTARWRQARPQKLIPENQHENRAQNS